MPPANTGGLLFWIVAGAVVCLLLIAVGLLGAMVRARSEDPADPASPERNAGREGD